MKSFVADIKVMSTQIVTSFSFFDKQVIYLAPFIFLGMCQTFLVSVTFSPVQINPVQFSFLEGNLLVFGGDEQPNANTTLHSAVYGYNTVLVGQVEKKSA